MNSQSNFHISQSKMGKNRSPGTSEYDAMRSRSDMKSNANLQSNTVKSKMLFIDDELLRLAKEMNVHSVFLDDLLNETNPLEELTKEKKESSNRLNSKFGVVEEEMQKHFAHQRAENARLQKQINELKSQQGNIMNQVFESKKKIEDLAFKIGIENLNL